MNESAPRRTPGHVDLLLLSAVADGPKHGYAIARFLDTRSGGRFGLKEGTLYPALRRLEEGGLVSSASTVVNGRQRHVYTITAAGRTTLASQRDEWQQYAAAMAGILGGVRP